MDLLHFLFSQTHATRKRGGRYNFAQSLNQEVVVLLVQIYVAFFFLMTQDCQTGCDDATLPFDQPQSVLCLFAPCTPFTAAVRFRQLLFNSEVVNKNWPPR
ncbi:TPA: hypothetical protein NVH55_004511 [Enterobacter hormaechei subsp. xiangfangensis]|nr:hypothetical protein [Enterobacter hormaechei subsp. xiangfangensis]